MFVPRRIYYEVDTGTPIQMTGNYTDSGLLEAPSIDKDFENYYTLSERNRDTVGVIELEQGQYDRDFYECNGYRINPTTKEIEFSYPDDSEQSEQQPTYTKPLSIEIEETKARIADLELTLAEMMNA